MAQDITPFCEAAGKLDFSTLYIWQDIWKAVMNAIVPFFIAYMFLKRMIWVHKVFHTCCMLSMSSTLLLLLLERALSLHPKSSDRICRLVCRAFICLELTVFSVITLQYYVLEGDQEWYILHCQEETKIMPYYTVVMPILYLYALKKLRQRRNDEFLSIKEPRLNGKIVPFSEIYHKKLRDAWQTLDALPKQRNSK
ncbi:unnamed protein product, partial [Mesorhabditis spiculigera]